MGSESIQEHGDHTSGEDACQKLNSDTLAVIVDALEDRADRFYAEARAAAGRGDTELADTLAHSGNVCVDTRYRMQQRYEARK